ncbi:MAG: hypothetical protein ACE5FK_01870 [Candidatus Methylomirabilia bacterium]
MSQTDRSAGFPKGSGLLKRLLIVLFGAGFLLPPAAASHEQVGVTGVLAALPEKGLSLPPSSTVTAEIAVPVKGDSDPISYSIDFTPRTVVHLERALVRNGQLVEVELTLQDDRLVVKEIEEVDSAR